MPRAFAATVICAAALLTPPAALAATIHYWQFESGAFWNDSVGGADLTVSAAGATEVAIPASGRGSSFDDVLAGNGSAADFSSSYSGVTASVPVPTGDFTIELLAHLDSFASSYGSHLAGNASTGSGWGWTLQVRHDGWAGTLVDSLILGVQNSSGVQYVLGSNIPIQTGKDYYLAVAFDTDGTTGGTATFYVQNLTDGGVLQSAGVAHPVASVLSAYTNFAIGGFAATSVVDTDGLIDQVRLSNTALTAGRLYIVPEPSTAALLGVGLLIAAWRRRDRTPSGESGPGRRCRTLSL